MGDLQKLAPPKAGRRRFKLTKFMLGLGLVLLLAAFFMGGWLLLAGRMQKVVAASWGTVEKGCWTEVLYLREERLLTAPADGTLLPQVKNGARVPQGEILALLDRKAGRSQNTTVSNSERQRYNRYQMLVRQETALNLDLRRIDLDLLQHLKNANRQGNGADLQALQQEKEEVIRNIQIIHAQSVGLGQELLPLLQRWQFITAAKPGNFITEYDGWENTLTPEYLEKLTLNDFSRKYPLKSCGRQVRTGETFGRLVNPFNQILAVKVTADRTGIPAVGTVWRFKTPAGWKSAPLTYVKMFSPQTGVAGVSLQTEKADLTKSRLSKMFVVCQKITGVTLPVQALFKNEDRTVVRLAKGSRYREQTVEVLSNDGSKAVVSGIDVGAMIISR